jgi:acetyltransferase-like isoleucine patch superfamily enzyme
MKAYLRTVLSRLFTAAVNAVFDHSIFSEPPLQAVKAAAFNRLLGSSLSPQCLVMPGTAVVRWHNLSVGRHSYLARYVRIDAYDKVVIGRCTTVGPGTFITTGGHSLEDLGPLHGPVRIGDGVFIGANVTILAGVTIGNHACVGAGAVVVKDVPDCAVVAGVPARVLKTRARPVRVWTVFGYFEVEPEA